MAVTRIFTGRLKLSAARKRIGMLCSWALDRSFSARSVRLPNPGCSWLDGFFKCMLTVLALIDNSAITGGFPANYTAERFNPSRHLRFELAALPLSGNCPKSGFC